MQNYQAMNPTREELLFQLALTKPAAERAMFLDRECGADDALRARLEALLSAHEQPETLLATQAVRRDELHESPSSAPGQGLTELSPPDAPDEAVGQTIGRYKLLEQIGEGGCGMVYVAEQKEPVRRKVALKVIKLGMDTKQVVARFEAERQALAMMDHPNIAKVLDAGMTLGAPASRRPEESLATLTEPEATPAGCQRSQGGVPTSSWNWCGASRSPITATRPISAPRNGSICSSRFARPSSMRTRRASSTATSSPRTSSSPCTTVLRPPSSKRNRSDPAHGLRKRS